jgi:glycosyltransferase involved in cell wall biosynthesis
LKNLKDVRMHVCNETPDSETPPFNPMTTAPVTVVVPTYNNGHLIGDALTSVLAQTARPEVVIVIDDGSTDDTADRVARFSTHVRYIHQLNQGVAAARNRGQREARSEFVAFLDADDVWHPRKLEIQLSFLHARPDFGLLGTGTYPWTGGATREWPGEPGAARLVPVPWERLVVRNAFATSSVVVRRAVLDRVGEFDTRLQGPEDHDLWLRVAEATPTGNVDFPLTGYRDVPGSLSKHARRMEEGMLRIIAKLGERGAWRGRSLLRCKACSMVYHQSAYMYGQVGAHMTAVGRSLRSLACYPWPYRSGECKVAFERPKWLARSLLNLFGWPDPVDHHR